MSNSRSFSFKFIAIILSAAMLLVSIPIQSLALGNIDEGNFSPIPEAEQVSSNAEILEVIENRTSNEKTFRLTDGLFYIAYYSTNVHERDENDNWVDIDNRLYIKGDNISTENNRYTFPYKTSDNKPLFSLSGKDNGVSFVLNNSFKEVNGMIINQSTEFEDGTDLLEIKTTLDNIKSTVIYKDILLNTDIEFIIYGTNVKENIIVKAKNPEFDYTYSFTLTLDNLVPVISETGQIDLIDPENGETVYFIPAPAMWDEAGEFSDEVYYELASGENGTYLLNIIADAVWINDESRVFPVTIDPPIYSDSSNVVDTYISSSDPSASHPDDAMLYVNNNYRSYWKITTLPELPRSAYITKAEFKAKAYPDQSTNTVVDVAVYEVLTDWGSTLTWDNTISNTNPAGQIADAFTDQHNIFTAGPVLGNYFFPETDEFTWNVTPIVKKWYDGDNYGLALAVPANGYSTNVMQFRSNNYSTDSARPSLCITYADMKGLEDYWSCTSQDVGFAGQTYINNATGNLVVNIPTLTTTDSLMPITLSLVYNLCMDFGDYKYPLAQTANTTAFTPKSFKLNINETLIKKSYSDASGNPAYYIIWADSDGTEHYFFPISAGSTTYTDEDGLHLTLNYSASSCTITDSNYTVKTFTAKTPPTGVSEAWYLTDITDKSGNKVVFSLDSYNRPTAVYLQPNGYSSSDKIQQLRIEYNSTSKKPYVIWNPTTGEGVVFFYSNSYSGSTSATYGNYLRKVIRAHVNIINSMEIGKWQMFYNINGVVDTTDITVDAVAEYDYNYLGLITDISNNLSGYKLHYTVYNNKKISSCCEYSITESTYGQKIGYTYNSSSAVIRTSGKDDIYNNADDLLTTHLFDNYGKTVSCYTTDLNKTKIYGASSEEFVGDENTKAKNSIKSSVQTNQQSSNYLLNGGFEEGTIQYWSTTGNVSIDSNSANTKNSLYAMKLCIESGLTSSSVYQYVDLDKGDYTVSLDYLTSNIPNGVTVKLIAESQSNSSHSVEKQLVVNKNSASTGYTFDLLCFFADPSTPGGKERFKISVLITGNVSSTVSMYVDNVMLACSTAAVGFDMIYAGHFETSYNMAPSLFWTILGNGTPPITVTDSGIPAFGDVLHIQTSFQNLIYPYQVVYQATDAMKQEYLADPQIYNNPELFTVSGWAKGTGQSYNEDSEFGIDVQIKYYTSTGGTSYNDYYVYFDRGITDWQFASGGFTSDPDIGMIDTITVFLLYTRHQGEGYFDSISIEKADTNTAFYKYNASHGYLTNKYNGENSITYIYDDIDGNKITSIVNNANNSITYYTYDSANRLKTETKKSLSDPNIGEISLNKTTYTYNTYGLVTQTVCEDLVDTSIKTKSSSTYVTSSGSHIFGAVSTETDSLGNVTHYFYDTTNGRLNAVTYPNGKGICYTYDSIGNITEILPAVYYSSNYTATTGGTEVDYGYDSATKRLSTITTHSNPTKTTVYTFEYDGFGNSSEISVGTRTLASYTYNSENGKLNKLVYGNGLNVQYVYDSLDRISEIKYRNGNSGSFTTAYTYTYDAAGHLRSVTDHDANEVTMYDYDLAGKLVNSYIYDQTNNYNKYSTTVYYDEETSKVSSTANKFYYNSISGIVCDNSYYEYEYDIADNIQTLTTIGGSILGTIEPQYDNLGRVKSRTLDYDIGGIDAYYSNLTYSYAYNGNYTSGRVAQLTSEIRIGANTGVLLSSTYKYTYDADGNITEIKDASNVVQYKYTYDNLGQLIREDNRPLNKSYVYTYDNAGNITHKYVYNSFTTGTLGTPNSTINYTYNDSSWSDLLTNYNGTSITYDNIGNPTAIGNATLTWKGRQLTNYVFSSTKNVSYTYNADGIRTSKTFINCTTTTKHEYILNGSQIVKETVFLNGNESYTLVYLYDEYGSPIGFRYRTPGYGQDVFNGYFFEKNLQGDIIGIWNQSGTKLVTYTYDAWGNVTVSGSGASGIGAKNPFRYRGYYYDTDTGFYYLQSRYYNPIWGRFINADGQLNDGLLGYNMFAYCGNNPINGSDPCGTCFHHWMFWKDCAKCAASKAEKKAQEIAQTIKYDVPLYKQGSLSLCWAFCQTMIESYNSGTMLTQKAAKARAIKIAQDYHGSTEKKIWNQGGWPSNLGAYVGNIGSIEELYNILRDNGPVYAYYSNNKSAHIVIVTGVNLYRGLVYTNNPWGVSGTQSFEKFQNGFATKWYHFSSGKSTSGAIIYMIN